MKTHKLFWVGFLTCVLLALLAYRISKPGKISVCFRCDEQLKNAFESALKKVGVDYKQSNCKNSTIIVFDNQLVYHDQVFKFYWNETLEKKILDVVLSHIKVEGDFQSQIRRFEQLISVSLHDQTKIIYTVRPEIDIDEIAYKIIKDIIKGNEKIFENGYLVLPLIIESDGEKLMIYDSRNDQVYMLLEPGGS